MQLGTHYGSARRIRGEETLNGATRVSKTTEGGRKEAVTKWPDSTVNVKTRVEPKLQNCNLLHSLRKQVRFTEKRSLHILLYCR